MLRLDDPLAPFVPSRDDPWDAARAAHLARRAGFGAPPETVAELAALAPEEAVARLVDFPAVDDELEERLERLGGDLVEPVAMGVFDEFEIERRTWFFRLVHGNDPLREKLVLLWHDHFACQASKLVRPPLFRAQLDALRRLAAAPFRELLGAIARDPGMLHFLDNRESTAAAPNENWARELVELFALGEGNYTQRDVTELARVFTGWTTPTRGEAKFAFDASMHDDGDKTVLGTPIPGRAGEAGIEEGEEALDVVAAHAACAPHLARTLLAWFGDHEVDGAVADALAERLRSCGLDVREGLRALFASRWFLARERSARRFANPVELAVGHARAAGVRNAHLAGLEDVTRRMGMRLLEPPSVGGWEHGSAWAAPGVASGRRALGRRLARMAHSSRPVRGRAVVDLDSLAREDDGALADAMVARFAVQPLGAERRALLVERIAAARGGRFPHRAAVRTALELVCSLPEAALA